MLCPDCGTENDDAARRCLACRAALPAAREGALLDGRYEIRSCLGKGGMGVVYEAYDRVLEERVAIKVLRGRDTVDAAAARRFRSEIKLARRVTHGNVCRIHDYGEDGGVAYISMQFVEGADLRAYLRKRGQLPPDEACEIVLQIAAGLQAVHDEGIVHRDLKPANVMIDPQGVARLMDFGIAKASAGGESMTTSGHIVGTPEYMSPEQIRGQPVDARSDVYALGVILFELFTGGVPFTSGSAVGTLMKHLHEEPPLEGPAASAVPPPLRQVIGRALAKERDHRYRSAREMADALRAARAAPAPPGSPKPAPPPRAAGRRRTLTILAAPALALSLWATWQASRLVGRRLDPPASPSPTSAPAPTPMPRAASTPRSERLGPPEVAASPRLDARAACDAGQAASCLEAGQRDESVSPPSAAALYRRACAGGSAAGCTRLGVLLNGGRGVTKDLAAAADFYEKGCQRGDGAGCNNLGTLYEFGQIGVGPDQRRALALYTRGCDLGDAPSCGNLGVVLIEDPVGGGAERERAIALLRRGCLAKAPRACRKLHDLGLASDG